MAQPDDSKKIILIAATIVVLTLVLLIVVAGLGLGASLLRLSFVEFTGLAGGGAGGTSSETSPSPGSSGDGDITPLPTDDVFKIYLHWSAGGYQAVAPAYTYAITGDGQVHQTNGTSHTFARNTNSVGISVMAMASGTMQCYTDLRGSRCPTPVTQAQINAMVTVAARIAKEKNIPIDSQHVLTHGEAGSNMDYPAGKVQQLMTCGNTPACANQVGLPHENYGPYRRTPNTGAPLERWEFYRQEGALRQMIQAKVLELP